MGENAARPGRPRDPQADAAILRAARDLMSEGGLANLTVEGTAQRAGVAKTTVYRRYPTKLALAVAAVAALISPEEPRSTTLEGAMNTGLAAFSADFTAQVLEPIEDKFRRSLELTGASPPSSSFAFDVLLGTMIQRLVIRQLPLDDDFESRFLALTRYVTESED